MPTRPLQHPDLRAPLLMAMQNFGSREGGAALWHAPKGWMLYPETSLPSDRSFPSHKIRFVSEHGHAVFLCHWPDVTFHYGQVRREALRLQ